MVNKEVKKRERFLTLFLIGFFGLMVFNTIYGYFFSQIMFEIMMMLWGGIVMMFIVGFWLYRGE